MAPATTPGGGAVPPVTDRQRLGRGAGARPLALARFLFMAVLALELILRARTEAPFLTVGLLWAAVFAGATALVITLVAGLLPGRARDVVVGLALAFVTLLFMSQLIYYDIFGTFYTVFSATNAGQVAEFAADIMGKIAENAWWLLALSVPLLIFVVSRFRAGARPRASWRQQAVTAGLLVVLVGAALAGINLGDRGQNSAYDMYYR